MKKFHPKSLFIKIMAKRDLTPLLVYTVIWIVIFINNLPDVGKYLIGWDSLTPELNFWLNLKRSFIVWQDFQGLGLMGGHGYWATWPHTLFIWVLSFLLPKYLLRYFFTLLCLYLGGLGIYCLTKKIITLVFKDRELGSLIYTTSFVSSLFYIVNLGTAQNFYTQLEAFIVHFAFLPFLIISLINLLEEGNRKNWINFFITNILILPASFIPPLFIVQIIVISIFLFFYFIKNLNKTSFKKIFSIVLMIFCVNAFWLLPFSYYTFKQSGSYLNSYNNQNSTKEFIEKNKKFGGIKNVSIARSFLLESTDLNEQGKLVKLYAPWVEHFDNKGVLFIGYTLFFIAVLGFIVVAKKIKESYVAASVLVAFFVMFTLLSTGTPPFSYFNEMLRSISSLFAQSFRIVFTKVSIVYLIFLSLLIGVGLTFLIDWIKHKLVKKFFGIDIIFIITAVMSLLLIVYGLPAFTGNLIYKRTKIKIPEKYFLLIEYMKTKPQNQRIMDLPQGWSWGWSIYDWGYTGSGFLHYALKQPIMHRSFDVWSPYNENYYWEITNALFSKNLNQFNNIITKYNIGWVIYDPSLLPYPQYEGTFESEEIEKMLSKSEYLELETNFDDILLFKVLDDSADNKVTFIESGWFGKQGIMWDNIDPVYSGVGNYAEYVRKDISSPFASDPYGQLYYPFRSLFISRIGEKPYDISVNNDSVSFNFKDFSSVFPTASFNYDKYFPVNINIKNIDNQLIELKVSPQVIAVNNIPINFSEKIETLSYLDFSDQQLYLVNRLTRIPIKVPESGESFYVGSFIFNFGEKNYVALEDESRKILSSVKFEYSENEVTKKEISLRGSLDFVIQKGFGDQVSYSSFRDKSFLAHNKHNCYNVLDIPAEFSYSPSVGSNSLFFNSDLMPEKTDECYSIILDELPRNLAYLVTVEYMPIKGYPLSFAVVDNKLKYTLYETVLEGERDKLGKFYYIITTREDENYGVGYSLNFKNLGGIGNINSLISVDLTPIPYKVFSSFNLRSTTTLGDKENILKTPSYVRNYSFYIFGPEDFSKGDTLVTDRSFSNGLLSVCTKKNSFFRLSLKCPLDEIVVNSWEHAFIVNQSFKGKVYLLFLPQGLQNIGYIAFITISAVVFKRKKGPKKI